LLFSRLILTGPNGHAPGCLTCLCWPQGKNELQQLDKIFSWCGSPSAVLASSTDGVLGDGGSSEWDGHKNLPFYESLKSICLKPQPRRLNKHPNLRALDGGLALELLDWLLKLNPSQRPSATAALAHRYFQEEPVVDLNQIDVDKVSSGPPCFEITNVN
jgi:serine/threonine protein kinase